jgi:AcrR family transcriptional regulator
VVESERDNARARILDAAEGLFAADGFDATPTARIAERAEVGKGLLFYYFPTKLDVLLALLSERLPDPHARELSGIVRANHVAASLVRLAGRIDLVGREAMTLRSIIFREVETHPEVAAYAHRWRAGLVEITESVLAAASPVRITARLRRNAAHVFVAVLLDEANARRVDAPAPDVPGAARLIAAGLRSQTPN